ncbi:MAG: amidohydrolase family protein [bacterium]
MEMDILIRGGDIVEGTGRKAYRADIAIVKGKIHDIGSLKGARAAATIDARGMVVCPGFIDIHGHSDISLMVCPTADSKIMQGITTEIGGNCGDSPGPLSEKMLDDYTATAEKYGINVSWRNLGDFLDRLEGRLSINYGTLVGLGTIRGAVMGTVDRMPGSSELSKMRHMVERALDEGALGVSTGLVYPPGMYSDTLEIVELARAASKKSAVYASHIRGEGKNLLPAIEEAIEIGRKGSIPVQISHLKAVGNENRGKMPDILSIIDGAVRDGVDVTGDRYPYTASATSLASLFPPWAHEGGRRRLLARLRSGEEKRRLEQAVLERIEGVGWDRIILTNAWSARNSDLEGKSLKESAASRNVEPFDLAVNIVLESGCLASIVSFSQDENDMLTTLTHPRIMVGSDSGVKSPEGVLGEGKPHPRCYGTFPEFFDLFVRRKKLLSLEDATRKMTGMSAARLNLKDRGMLKKGYWADVVVFDDSRMEGTATYQNPHSYPRGIEYVIVNGKVVVNKGTHTKATPGMVLRRAGWFIK